MELRNAFRGSVPSWRLSALKLVTGVLIVVLWPLGLAAGFAGSRGESAQPKATDSRMEALASRTRAGLRFERMGGAGRLRCGDCGFSQRVLSFTHAFDGSHTSGYQCQTCGAFHAVDYEPAFREGTPESQAMWSLAIINSIQSQMSRTPRNGWLESWESDLAEHGRRLQGVDVEAIRRKHAEAQAALKAKLFCHCGGPLSRDEVISCPSCRSRNLRYETNYIT
jgi:hypothetical protein